MTVAAAPRASYVDSETRASAESKRIAIRATGVGRVFETGRDDVQAIRDVSIEIRRGEFLVIVGPSGCGKTTFLRIIAGLESATSGSIETPSGSMRSAMVFQGRSVFPWLTVEQNVSYGLRLSGVPRRERRDRVASLVATVGLERFSDAFPHQLSEGMRQRVAIARALAVDPDLLLLDEPFSALDEQTKILLQEEVLRLWETSGKTVVFVTHSIDEGLVMGDRIVVMTALPGTIKAEVDVPFDRPRHLREVRSDPAFADRFGAVWDLLRDEVARSRVQAGEL